MGIWTTKFRKPAIVAGLLAISLAANTALAKPPVDGGSKRGGVGFTSGAILGGAAAGPLGAVVGASLGAVMGERSHKKNQALAERKAEAALLASELETLNSSLSTIETKAGEVGSTVQFRTGQTAVRDNDRARLAKLGALVADLKDVRVRVSGFADSRGDDALNLSLSQERADMVARELEKAGVPKERMIIEALGERFASTESVADDQAFERCVEIRFESGSALASN
ncbi:MAG TPA: OmpA family protein [Steroidobacteraceae bacterium]|jgi:outer membrane protein OmpA-like peptidoglycan-associated protein|nr:OmpA family protein [Steroidobacteraceae bacterium]